MKFDRRPARQHRALELTALMDVMFILLIFFMLNAQLERRQGLSLKLPEASQTRSIVEQSIEISLNSLNQISIDGRSISKGELRSWLEQQPRTLPILIQADQDASYGKALQIFDLLQSLNYQQVSLGTTPPRL